jgi:hypothetical protein
MTTALELARKLAQARGETEHLRRELEATQKALDNALDTLVTERSKNAAPINEGE